MRLCPESGMLSTYMLAVLFLISWLSTTLYIKQEHVLLSAMNLKEAQTYLCTEAVVLATVRCSLQEELPEQIQKTVNDVSFEAERTSYGYLIHVHQPVQEEILLNVEEKSRALLDYDTVRSASPASITSIS